VTHCYEFATVCGVGIVPQILAIGDKVV
jgi:hypothetical protein